MSDQDRKLNHSDQILICGQDPTRSFKTEGPKGDLSGLKDVINDPDLKNNNFKFRNLKNYDSTVRFLSESYCHTF